MTAAQGTYEWLLERCGDLTGSKFSDILPSEKTGKYLKSRENLLDQLIVENITGVPVEQVDSKATKWGNRYESEALTTYKFRTGLSALNVGYYKHNHLQMIGASTDFIIENQKKGGEIKCPFNSSNHLNYIRNGLPKIYKAQVQGNMWVRELDYMDFVSYDPRMPENIRIFIKEYERDEEYIQMLEYESIKFIGELKNALNDLLSMELSTNKKIEFNF